MHEPISYRQAKWILAGFMVMGLLTVWITRATAAGPVTKQGIDYSGIPPTTCTIEADHVTDLSVDCRHVDDNARVRYRMLADVGAIRDFASVEAGISTWVGFPCQVDWMVSAPRHPARTVRIFIPAGSYCEIHWVRWSQ